LPVGFGGGDIDPFLSQAPQVFGSMTRIDDVKCAITFFEPILDERHQDAIFLFLRVEEGTHVAGTIEYGSGQSYRLHRIRRHGFSQ
jgi:hypothetical protein